MRRLMTLGLLSAAAALTVACGDDDPGPGTGGSGGSSNGGTGGSSTGGTGGSSTAGSGGSSMGGTGGSGMGGSGGDAGSSGDGGSAGDGGDGGSVGDPDAGDGGDQAPCNGCVELRVPVVVSGNNQTTLFQFTAGGPFDLSNAVITFRVRALTIDNQFSVSPFAQDNSGFNLNSSFTAINAGNGFTDEDTFVELTYDLTEVPLPDLIGGSDAGADGGNPGTPDPADFDKSSVAQFGLIVGAAAGSTVAGTVAVVVDSVTFEGVDLTDVTFTASAEGFAVNTFADVDGSEVIHHP